MPTEENSNAPQPDIPPEPEVEPEQKPEEVPPVVSTPIQSPLPASQPLIGPPPTDEDERRTLAELFVRLPVGAKVGVVAALALVLTLAVLVAFPPARQQNEAEHATGTAVAAILTLTAQPTPTSIGTETPRIYIVEESPIPSLTPDVTSTPIIYVVKQGDTLNSIARSFNSTVQDIATANGLYNVNSISVGQELMIPTPGSGTVVPVGTVGLGTPTALAGTAVSNEPLTVLPELVIKGVSGVQTVDLRIAAGPDYQAITTLNRGTIASLVAKSPDGLWYLIQLEDGYTRGWIPANSAGLLYPADPANIPTTPQP
ncbi:MAG: LysM peptidoglycan-binding domain-containing protein [Ardenticatenaceae bacterium]|nr:LysM peptidoglycan-binding domain-containing protein [Ardenticatenaceae bacterium]